MKNPIDSGTSDADELGFTEDKFYGYLWKTDNTIMVSLIVSHHPGKGNFSAFVRGLLEKGYTVKVPTPFPNMLAILKHMHFHQTWEISPLGDVEVWVKEAKL